MKKEELKQAIDNIQPDIHMKTRLKAKIFSGQKTHRFSRSIAALCLVAAIISGIALITPANEPQSEKSSETLSQSFTPSIMKAFIVVASAADEEFPESESASKTLELNEEYTYGVHLKVVDIRGLSDSEKKEILNELNNELAEYCNSNNFSIGRSMVCGTENFYLSQFSINEFKLDLENCENIRSVNVSNTSIYGQVVHCTNRPTFSAPEHGSDITISGEDFDCETDSFYWDHTEEMEKALDTNINIPFSAFNDTITFTVEYNDGAKAVGVIELNFDSAGNATTVCKNYEYQKAGD